MIDSRADAYNNGLLRRPEHPLKEALEAPLAANTKKVTSVFNKWNRIAVSLLMLSVADLPAVGIDTDKETGDDANGVRIFPFAADQAARLDIPPVIINRDIWIHVEDVFDTLSRMSKDVKKIQQSEFGKLPTVAPKLQNIIVSLQRIPKHRKIPLNYARELENDAKKLENVKRVVSPPGPAPQGEKGIKLYQIVEYVSVDLYNKSNALEKGM